MGEGEGELWWHCYGGRAQDGTWGENVFALFILGESTMHPEQLAAEGRMEIQTPGGSVFRYLRSFNHDPSEKEKQGITPAEYWS